MIFNKLNWKFQLKKCRVNVNAATLLLKCRVNVNAATLSLKCRVNVNAATLSLKCRVNVNAATLSLKCRVNLNAATLSLKCRVNLNAATLSLKQIKPLYTCIWGTRWRSWLRHCDTSRKVADSTLDDVIGIFHWHNPSGRTMALGSTQPLTEMSTRSISWGVKAAGT
jgi:hypothetical protein